MPSIGPIRVILRALLASAATIEKEPYKTQSQLAMTCCEYAMSG